MSQQGNLTVIPLKTSHLCIPNDNAISKNPNCSLKQHAFECLKLNFPTEARHQKELCFVLDSYSKNTCKGTVMCAPVPKCFISKSFTSRHCLKFTMHIMCLYYHHQRNKGRERSLLMVSLYVTQPHGKFCQFNIGTNHCSIRNRISQLASKKMPQK